MRFVIAALIVALAATASASDVSWIFLPGYYTHRDGHRVAQYEPEKPSYVTVDPTYQQSGYHHQSFGCGGEHSLILTRRGATHRLYPWPHYYRSYP